MASHVSTIAASADKRRAWRALLHLCLPLVSALLLAAAFPPLEWRFLAWVALLLLCFVLTDKAAFLETYLGTYLGGLTFQLVHLDWLRTTGGSVGLEGTNALNWLLQGAFMGLFWPVMIGVGRRLVHKTNWPLVILLPVTWVSFEFARRHVWRIFVDQTGSPWGQLGYTQADVSHLAQIADLGGVYAVGGLVAAVNGALWDVSSNWFRPRTARKRALRAAIAAVAMVVTAWVYGAWRLHEGTPHAGPSVALMPAWTPSVAEKNPLDGQADILLWSELDSNQTIWELAQAEAADVDTLAEEVRRLVETPTVEQQENVIGLFEDQARRLDATLVIGCERQLATPERIKKFNSLACVHPVRGYLGCYDKVFLVPWTEFSPATIFRVVRRGSRRYTRGEEYPVFVARSKTAGHEFHFTPSICYDNCFAHFYRTAVRRSEPPEFFLHGGSEGKDPSYQLARNMLQMTKFRAIESRRAIVRNIAHGYSGLIDANGRYNVRVPERVIHQPFLIRSIPVDSRRSLYARWGDWLAWGAVGICGVLMLAPRRMLRSNARQNS